MVEKCIYYKMCRIINHHGYCYVEKGCECDHYLKEAVKTPTNNQSESLLCESCYGAVISCREAEEKNNVCLGCGGQINATHL